MKEIDHRYTKNIVCPYCGDETDDTDYRIDNYMEGEEICEKCDKKFDFEADIDITWVTEKRENPNDR